MAQGHVYDKQFEFSSGIRKEDTWFRVKAGAVVKYVHVKENTFSTCWNAVRFKDLPELPWHDHRWNVASFSTLPDPGYGTRFQIHLEWRDLESVHESCIWHPTSISVLDIYDVRPAGENHLEASVSHEMINGGTVTNVFAKTMLSSTRHAREAMERELTIYQVLKKSAASLSLRYLANLTEGGRIMGYILERPSYRASILRDVEEMWRCVDALQRFHDLGYVHGQPHNDAFITLDDRSVRIVNFGKARPGTEAERKNEYNKFGMSLGAIYDHSHSDRRFRRQ